MGRWPGGERHAGFDAHLVPETGRACLLLQRRSNVNPHSVEQTPERRDFVDLARSVLYRLQVDGFGRRRTQPFEGGG